MSTGYSKTLLRKGALKAQAGHAVQRHAPKRKGITAEEEDALLHSPAKSHARPPHGAKMRAE